MNESQFDELYSKLYDAYADASLKDEYVRSTLGDVMDYMINLRQVRMGYAPIPNKIFR